MTTKGQFNDTRVTHQIIPTNFTCSMISRVRLKGPCSYVRSMFLSAQSNFNYCRSVINKTYLDKYKTQKMYAKIRVAVGVYFSI